MDTNRFIENLARQAEENPVMALGVAAALITSISKFVDASGHRKGSIAYAKQVNAKLKSQGRPKK